jgi:peptide/nickel transport system permease protein
VSAPTLGALEVLPDTAPAGVVGEPPARSRSVRGLALPLGRMLVSTITVFLLATVLTFLLGAMSGANPAAAVLGETATPDDIARMNHQFGLDRPLWQQYVDWLGHALHGNLGVSWFTTLPVTDSIKQALPVDLSIAGLALVLAVLIGGSAGIAAALSNGGPVDRAVTVVCSLVATMPPFVIGMLLIVVFSVKLHALPSGGYVPPSQSPAEWARFAILPALALSIEAAGALARQLRTSLVGSLRENYAVGAEMRGFSRRRVLFGHVLRNASGPALAVLGLAVPAIIGGAVITEKLFNLPGIAQLSLNAAEQGDIPVILGALLVTVVVVLAASTVVNLAQTALNPLARRPSSRPGGAS